MMKQKIYSTEDIDFPYYQYVTYRIQHKQENGLWYFRHIWVEADSSQTVDDWKQIGMSEKEAAKIKGAA